MTVLFALIRKGWLDVRWMLLMIAGTAFGLCWLFVFFTRKIEARPRFPAGVPTIEIEMRFWENVPLFLLMIAIWAIARGSAAVAGEVEKGTIDLILSRPVSRLEYLVSQLVVGSLGLAFIVAAMVAGNLTGAHYNTLKSPPSLFTLSKPALNLAAYGWAIYGYTFLLSSVDIVRWRPTMIASVATLAGYIAHVVANIPQLDEWWKWIDHLSIYRACRLLEVATKGETLAFNAGLLWAIGAVGVAAGFAVFLRRDLPAAS